MALTRSIVKMTCWIKKKFKSNIEMIIMNTILNSFNSHNNVDK